MRVRINYSVDTEEIIDEINRFINKAEQRLQDQVGNLHRARDRMDEDQLDNALKQIDLTRQELTKYDQALEDCFAILQGYNELLKRNENGDTNEQPELENG